MKRTVEQLVGQPVERLFPFLADPRNRPLWQASLDRVQLDGDADPHVGMRWRERPKGLVAFDMAIVALERHRLWAEHLQGKGVHGTMTLHFRPEGASTRVRVEVALSFHGPLKLGEPIAARILAREIGRDLARAGRILDEGGAPGAQASVPSTARGK